MGRFEANQWKRPEMSDIRDLLRIYGVDARRRRGTGGAGHASAGPAVVAGLPDIFDNEFPGSKRRRADQSVHAAGGPGLLQTPDYADALVRTEPGPRSGAAARWKWWLRRQEILNRTDETRPS